MFIDYSIYINDILLGLFVGIGSSLGNFIVNRGLIKRIEQLEKRWKNGIKQKD